MSIFDRLLGKKPPVDASWLGKAAMGAKPGLTMPDILGRAARPDQPVTLTKGQPIPADLMRSGEPETVPSDFHSRPLAEQMKGIGQISQKAADFQKGYNNLPDPGYSIAPPTVTPQYAAPETSGVAPLAPMAQAKRFTNPGVFDRIGDFINSDEGRGALLRSGAATLQGGLGAGIAAGANWIDKSKADAAGQARWDKTFGLQEQGVQIDQQRADTDGLYKAGQLEQAALNAGIDLKKVEAAIEKDRAGLALDAAELASLNWYRQQGLTLDYVEEGGRNSRTAATNATSRANNIESNSTARRGQEYGFMGKMAGEVYGDTGSTSVTTEDEDGVKTTNTKKTGGAAPQIKLVNGKRYLLDPIAGQWRMMP